MSDEKKMQGRSGTIQTARLADLCNEAGMLAKIPRSGYAFLGSGGESVAEHSWRATVIGHLLGRMAGVDAGKVAMLCLYHDLHESRTGDFNYVNHRYNTCRPRDALQDALDGTGLQNEIMALWEEFEAAETTEAKLAKDADQLELICGLAEELGKGNQQARDWLDSALPRLRTEEGRLLASAILRASPDGWWRRGVDSAWWVNHGEQP